MRPKNRGIALGLSGLFALGAVPAAVADTQLWTISGKLRTFHVEPQTNLIVDQDCHRKGEGCEALRKLKTVDLDALTADDRKGGKNPGGQLCQKSLGGKVVMGVDAEKNRATFCRFSDGSYLDNGSIYIEAVRKKNR